VLRPLPLLLLLQAGLVTFVGERGFVAAVDDDSDDEDDDPLIGFMKTPVGVVKGKDSVDDSDEIDNPFGKEEKEPAMFSLP
jgi:hypothetical protein